MADGHGAGNGAPFTETDRKLMQTGHGERNVLFVVSSYSGDAGPPLPVPVPVNSHGNHWVVAASSLLNSAIGAGVLAFPYAFQQAGLVPGILMTPFIAASMGFALYVLTKTGERFNSANYLELTRKALGKKLAALVCVLLIAYQLGSCVAYMVIVGDTFSSLADVYLGSSPKWLADRRAIIGAISLFVVIPLCLLRRLGHLKVVNAFAIVGFIYAAGLVIIMGSQIIASRPHAMHDVKLFKHDTGALFAIPIIVFGFTCHSNSVSVFYELAQPRPPARGLRAYLMTRMPTRSLRLQAMLAAITTAILVAVVFYTAVGAIGYIAWPLTVSGNILNTLPEGNVWVQIARGCIGVVVLNHIPMSHFPARLSFEHLVSGGLWTVPEYMSNIFTAVFVAGIVAISMFVTDLGSVVHLLGGTAASIVVFFVPGLLLVNASVIKHSQQHLQAHEAESGSATPQAPQAAAAAASTVSLHEPLLAKPDSNFTSTASTKWQRAASYGLKATGPLVYMPGTSWGIGMAFIAASAGLLVLTVVTAILH